MTDRRTGNVFPRNTEARDVYSRNQKVDEGERYSDNEEEKGETAKRGGGIG